MPLPLFEDCVETTIAFEDVRVFAHTRHLPAGCGGTDAPIVVCLHGYPQSSYMFRHAPSYLPEHLPLFIPDLPGYGASTKATPTTDTAAYTKRALGTQLLGALAAHLQLAGGLQPVILLAHDRGARIAHALAVHYHPRFEILAAALCDIVPTAEQFASLGDPHNAASTFHWALLAAAYPIPERMIWALGGAAWVQIAVETWGGCGVGEDGRRALEVYQAHFERPEVVAASCADYRAAAMLEAGEQRREQALGCKVPWGIKVLVLYSEKYLGARYDVPKVWREWVADESALEVVAVGCGVGHFLFEQAPAEAYGAVCAWMRDTLGVKWSPSDLRSATSFAQNDIF
ncbi:Alpha/Beta hydrolase protein [Geopyxis carbonaria]|nr:Alpha/Beta hydrolase protein [Geopyxis carbonaria]